MNLKTLFSAGIFKNNIKRFKWGGFLYFVFLFLSVPFAILVDNFESLSVRYSPENWANSILLRGDYITIPILLAFVVPTVVGVLIFGSVHSPKQSVFVHGLPVKRLAHYVSDLLSGFFLMAIPVLLNAVVLLIMSLGRYGELMPCGSVVYWAFVNLSILFIMFSLTAFSAFLTGNAAVHIGINVFLHIIPLLLALVIFLVSDIFLYGFTESTGFVANKMVEHTPVVWIFAKGLSHYKQSESIFAQAGIWVYLFGAVLMYVFGYLLYKSRKIETSGDVAAFKVFRPILKYAVTASVAVCTFGITSSMYIAASANFVVAIVLTLIAYFASEMLICKTFKVFRSYKGYLGFLAFSAAFICFFAYTSVFGYETRIPDAERIISAGITENYRTSENMVDDKAFVEEVQKIHKELVKDIPTTDEESEGVLTASSLTGRVSTGRRYSLRVRYCLENGKTMDRLYRVDEATRDRVMGKMYENTEFKLKATEIERLNIENIDRLVLSVTASDFDYDFSLNGDDARILMENVKKDIEGLGYAEIKAGANVLGFRIGIDTSYLENIEKRVFKETVAEKETFVSPVDKMYTFDIEINSEFENAYNFLKEKGYYGEAINAASQNLWICKKPVKREGDSYAYKDDKGDFGEFWISPEDCEELLTEDAARVAELMANTKHRELPDGKSYFVFNRSRTYDENLYLGNNSIAFSENEVPDYLKKYLAE